MGISIVVAVVMFSIVVVAGMITIAAIDDSNSFASWWWVHARAWVLRKASELSGVGRHAYKRELLAKLSDDDVKQIKSVVSNLEPHPIDAAHKLPERALMMSRTVALTLTSEASAELIARSESLERQAREQFNKEIAGWPVKSPAEAARIVHKLGEHHYSPRSRPAPRLYRKYLMPAVTVILDYVGRGMAAAVLVIALPSVALGLTDSLEVRVAGSALWGSALGLVWYFARLLRFWATISRTAAIGMSLLTAVVTLLMLAALLSGASAV